MKKPSELTNKHIGKKLYNIIEGGAQYAFVARHNIDAYEVLSVNNDTTCLMCTYDSKEMDSTFSLEKPKKKTKKNHKKKPVVDWSVIPSWFKYVAMDNDGEWCAYRSMPSNEDNTINKWLHEEYEHRSYIYIHKEYTPKFDGDWKDSLVERPK